MTVPEASVDKDSHLFNRPDEVGISSDWLVPTPALQAGFSQQMSKTNFGRLIAFAMNPRHKL
jgi:hypothetical protein